MMFAKLLPVLFLGVLGQFQQQQPQMALTPSAMGGNMYGVSYIPQPADGGGGGADAAAAAMEKQESDLQSSLAEQQRQQQASQEALQEQMQKMSAMQRAITLGKVSPSDASLATSQVAADASVSHASVESLQNLSQSKKMDMVRRFLVEEFGSKKKHEEKGDDDDDNDDDDDDDDDDEKDGEHKKETDEDDELLSASQRSFAEDEDEDAADEKSTATDEGEDAAGEKSAAKDDDSDDERATGAAAMTRAIYKRVRALSSEVESLKKSREDLKARNDALDRALAESQAALQTSDAAEEAEAAAEKAREEEQLRSVPGVTPEERRAVLAEMKKLEKGLGKEALLAVREKRSSQHYAKEMNEERESAISEGLVDQRHARLGDVRPDLDPDYAKNTANLATSSEEEMVDGQDTTSTSGEHLADHEEEAKDKENDEDDRSEDDEDDDDHDD